jgi:rfaE bifunctional protein kinase chain/domain
MDAQSRKLVSHKIRSAAEIATLLGPRPRAKKVIMCHGTFDVVHPGHVRHLLYAKSKADVLVASITADAHVTKASLRPYVPQDLRAINLAALEAVDYVVVDPNPTPVENLKIIQPDYYAKGYEYSGGHNPKTQEEIRTLESFGGEILFTPGDIVYSSSRLIESGPPDIGVEKLMLLMDGESLDFGDLHDALDSLKGVRVHVVGDTIVDSLTHCSMIGGMTKTPTMSVLYENKVDYVGGAGIVAKHLRAAGAEVTFSTVLGDDALKDFVLADLGKAGVKARAIVDPTRPTTNKNAIVAGGYRLLKIDTLDNRSISDKILDAFRRDIAEVEADIVCFSDFRHGLFNRATVPPLMEAIPAGRMRVADSQVASRWGNILEFQGFDLITPNEREARFALGDQDSAIRPLATALFEQARCRTLILKLGDRGILTYRTRPPGDDPRTVVALDSFANKVVDPVGAGDALLAYAALVLFAKGNDVLAAILGNIAAGVECGMEGNEPVTPDAVRQRIKELERVANLS